MARTLFDGELFADYHQFYLCDEAVLELPDDYNDESIERRLMAGSHGIVVQTARNTTVPVRVEWHDEKNEQDLSAFQHAAEAGFTTTTDRLLLAGLTDYTPDAARLPVRTGPLGVRVCFSGLDTIDDFGIEGEDRYLVQIWPGLETPDVRVLKARQSA